ncbi:MAG TPA: bifunctional 3-phosphoshikimate 1-carboxyvinyltransferase/cytidylate kinase [Burkholderiales bacterium]|nr:bifunctional 3-phosphoshikimate 1-carboxyvinyltransferase/cytidylate kinase [Burkholderiales bacterium]
MKGTPYIELGPFYGAAGTVRLPGSKSISNRVLLLAALARGETRIRDLLISDDTDRMVDALVRLGVTVERAADPTRCRIVGCGGRFPARSAQLFLGNAGTALRPLTAVLALNGGHYRVSGVPRMHERPIGDLVDALRSIGARIRYLEREGYPPLEILPAQLNAVATVRMRGEISSQFLSALLMALPLLGRETTVEVVGELISKPYVEMTLDLMARFGVSVAREGWARFRVAADAAYIAPGEIHVEGDASGASYFLAAGAIGGGPVRVEGVGRSSIQGDVRFVEVLQACGARVDMGDRWIEARAPESGRLRAVDLDLNHIPDAGMTLAIVALFCDGTSRLRNVGSWRVKETDRIVAMANELRKVGASVEEGPDYLIVTPPATGLRPDVAIDTYDDHRIAMCFSLVSLGGVRVRINDPACVSKTFPDYFERFAAITAAPVIAIDGPSGSGKGTIAQRVAQALGFHYLDSGALYRLVALHALRSRVSLDDSERLAQAARSLPVAFSGTRIMLAGEDVTEAIRTEDVAEAASRVAAIPAVRQALMQLQRSFRRPPGLVAEGRDMGSVVFPDAVLKVFLTASVEARAERRHKQLIDKGLNATLAALLRDIEQRDARDTRRSVAPLQKSAGAQVLDTTCLTIEEAVDRVLDWSAEALRRAPSH